ncbi:ABC transporter [Nitritalea halalkaliphila LW7]|uniref:ABC transporter n=1 Tax=Nitritalea halalkaliphila LW7 TaxID=1189621 RepID=I5BV46_9BACT|nr:ABC transporter [Nitritalea halalkaliphila LW7]
MNFESKIVLQLQDACIQQGLNVVLKQVDFSLEANEFVFLIGRTGSGKSSLLKTSMQICPSKSGRVNWLDSNSIS